METMNELVLEVEDLCLDCIPIKVSTKMNSELTKELSLKEVSN